MSQKPVNTVKFALVVGFICLIIAISLAILGAPVSIISPTIILFSILAGSQMNKVVNKK